MVELQLTIRIVMLAALGMATAIFVVSKLFVLATSRLGSLVMLANVVYESLKKKLGVGRWWADGALLAILTGAFWALLGPEVALVVAAVMVAAWLASLKADQIWRSGVMARPDSRYGERVPIPIPRLIVVVKGPILARGRVLELGTWPLGKEESFEIVVLNPSLVRPQLPMEVELISSGQTLEVSSKACGSLDCPEPGSFVTVPFSIRAAREGAGGRLSVRVTHGDLVIDRELRLKGVVQGSDAIPVGAEIRRWKGGARAGFAWRGDQDLYDPSTFQSAEGLRAALGLSMRFRLPSTLFISGRLSLVEEEHQAFCQQFGWNRHSEEIGSFIKFFRDEVKVSSCMEFPMTTEKSFAVELGNHMYLHLGTHAAADRGNGWKLGAWIGEGEYPWHNGPAGDSFSEQRDNAKMNDQTVTEKLGVKMTSWGVPGRVYDRNTPRAVEAAGLEVGTDTNASAWTNVMRLVPPHHPEGCERLVEITKKYPGDPNDAFKIAMLKYWLHAARRAGGTFLFMAHHHLLMYEGTACYHLTEEFFRHLLGECDGDFYVATVTSLGRYWRDVLSPRTRTVSAACNDGRVEVWNAGKERVEKLPLEIQMAGGGRFMTLIDLDSASGYSWTQPVQQVEQGKAKSK